MTIADKLDVMETLWADLARRPVELPSPDWHREVLMERKRLVEEGKLKFLDWETAFAELRDVPQDVTLSPPACDECPSCVPASSALATVPSSIQRSAASRGVPATRTSSEGGQRPRGCRSG